MRKQDPRGYQIAVLSGLLSYGVWSLDLGISGGRVVLLLAVCLATQYACTRLWKLERYDPRSALISGLSLCLLLRTSDPLLAVVGGVVAVSSKFLIRVDGRHLVNPTNFGLVVMMLATDRVWVSPGQWGSVAVFGFLLACVGVLVVNRAARSDVTYAFLGCFTAIVVGRTVWLGDPLAIAMHTLQSGGLVLFAFFMISDPKTTPDSRAGRVLFALLVSLGAAYVQFLLHRPNGVLWSLVLCSMTVPLINRWLPGQRFTWANPSVRPGELPVRPEPPVRHVTSRKDRNMRQTLHVGLTTVVVVIAVIAATAQSASAFCGFYVTKADTELFNEASQVVLVRDGDRTVMTMANDFRGDPTEFAMVIPVPTVLGRDQIHVGDMKLIDHLDAYSAPRLVEYFDQNPCQLLRREALDVASTSKSALYQEDEARNRALGVAVEASYTVGEYDILILSARQSDGLETWLTENGYRIPPGASDVLGSYIKQDMRFFVARVNLEEQSALGFVNLRPLQIAYESPKFMLPIRLGMVNANGPQDLFVYALTRTGRVETTNYRTVKLPSDVEVPLFLKDGQEFGDFYQAMFSRRVDQENRRGVFLEYAWDMSWCDPCAANPPSRNALRELGVYWVDPESETKTGAVRQRPTDVFITRLHVRYDAEHFPDDLRFQETGDRSNFQGRYILRHPWTGNASCEQVAAYRQTVAQRHERQAQVVASLTGWDISTIRQKMGTDDAYPVPEPRSWWQRLWDR